MSPSQIDEFLHLASLIISRAIEEAQCGDSYAVKALALMFHDLTTHLNHKARATELGLPMFEFKISDH